MAEAVAVNPQASLLPLLRQAGIMIGLAAAVALGLYVVMWARTPEYAVLYTELTERDLTEVVDALAGSDTQYRIDHRSGVILVAADQVHELRIRLASQGLPRSAGMGFEMLSEEQGFGTSQFREQARFQRAVEAELSRSISRINNVRSARVHLAVPRQSAFSRNRRDPTASVVVDLYNGRRLEDHQVGAIVHMVSASVPSMRPAGVTVIDQQGNLLSDGDGDGDELALTAKRFEYTRRIEQSYINRVEAILLPMVGPGGVHAQVTAELDFTAVERTRESFNPDLPAVRSESIVEQERRGKDGGGVPGALSNEPPLPTEVSEEADAGDATTTVASAAAPSTRRSETTRNYELDRTIAHTRSAVGEVRRLSVAVVVRNPKAESQPAKDADGDAAGSEYDAASLARMEQLVREAVGFNAARGDSVSVTNVDFVEPEMPEPLPEAPVWEQPWVWSIVKQVLGGTLVLFLVFGIIRPTVKSLLAKNEQAAAARSVELLPDGSVPEGAQPGQVTPQGLPQPMAQLTSFAAAPALDGVKTFVEHDPKAATQVIKGWIKDS